MTIEEIKMKINQKIEMNQHMIDAYDNHKDNLSDHGHWSLGWSIGVDYALMQVLLMLDDFEKE